MGSDKTSRKEKLMSLMKAAGCTKPKEWVSSEIQEDIPQFARFLVLNEVHKTIDDVQGNLSECGYENPEIQRVLNVLRTALSAEDLYVFLRAYGKSLGNGFVMLLDEGPSFDEEGAPGFLLMEADQGEPTERLIQGLHEDYLCFEENYEAPVDTTGCLNQELHDDYLAFEKSYKNASVDG